MNNNEPRRDEIALAVIHEQITAGKIQLYRNVLRQPYVFCDHPKFPGLHAHLHDQDFRGWLTHFIWVEEESLLHEREVDRILEELAGRSLTTHLDKVHDPALLQFIEHEPVVAVVVEFMHTKSRHEATMDALWNELEKFARGRRLLVLGKKRFPGGPNVLSRKLAQFVPVFEMLGITIETRRSNGCKITLTRRLDDTCVQSSQQPSVHNPASQNELPRMDAKAALLAALEAKRSLQEPPSNSNGDRT